MKILPQKLLHMNKITVKVHLTMTANQAKGTVSLEMTPNCQEHQHFSEMC